MCVCLWVCLSVGVSFCVFLCHSVRVILPVCLCTCVCAFLRVSVLPCLCVSICAYIFLCDFVCVCLFLCVSVLPCVCVYLRSVFHPRRFQGHCVQGGELHSRKQVKQLVVRPLIGLQLVAGTATPYACVGQVAPPPHAPHAGRPYRYIHVNV